MPTPSKDLKGRRIRLVHCNDSYSDLAKGSEGTVNNVDDAGTLHVKWDSGSTRTLCWDDGDRWVVLQKG